MAQQFSINDGKSWKARFFTVWGGQAFSILGSQFVQFARIWFLTVKTGSTTVLATASLVALLLNILPLQGILAIDVFTAMLVVLPLFFIQVPQPERFEQKTKNDAQPTIWQDFIAGFRFILGWPGLLIVGLVTVGINFTIIPAFSLLPLMVKDYFGGNVIHLSRMESAMGIGVMTGGALLGIWGGFKRKILTSMVGLLGLGAGSMHFDGRIWFSYSGCEELGRAP